MSIYVIFEYEDGKIQKVDAENDYHATNIAYTGMFMCREDGRTPVKVSITFDFTDGKPVVFLPRENE